MPNDFSRIDRVQELIQVELAAIIQKEISDPRLGMITLTGVDVSKDMKHAKVYVTVLPDEKAKESVQTLNHACGFIRFCLGKRVTFRTLPRLRFYHDDTTIQANRVSKLIDMGLASEPDELDELSRDSTEIDSDRSSE